jgi:AcrR family transcriptional regulator
VADAERAGGRGGTPRKKRRPQRSDEILAAATKLFHEKGYHGTGMDDIGAAAGITGPAIYRHFKSKDDILEQILLNHSNTALERAHELAQEAATPLELLRGLVALYVQALVDNPAVAHVGMLERRTLQGETKASLERSERLHAEEWVSALTRVRPELSDAEARVMVQGSYGLAVLSSIYRSGLTKEAVSSLINEMIMNALLSEAPVEA